MSQKKCPSGNCNCLAAYKTDAPCNDHTNFTCFRLIRFKDLNGRKPYRDFPIKQSALYRNFEKTGKVDEECPVERKKHHKKHDKHNGKHHGEGAAHAMMDTRDLPVLDMNQYIQS